MKISNLLFSNLLSLVQWIEQWSSKPSIPVQLWKERPIIYLYEFPDAVILKIKKKG